MAHIPCIYIKRVNRIKTLSEHGEEEELKITEKIKEIYDWCNNKCWINDQSECMVHHAIEKIMGCPEKDYDAMETIINFVMDWCPHVEGEGPFFPTKPNEEEE